MIDRIHVDHRQKALDLFNKGIEPLLALARRYPDPEEIIVDGDKLLIEAGEGLIPHDLKATGLDQDDIRALADNAAVYDGAEFGEILPARAMLSVKIPPDLRVSCVIPPVADEIGICIRFLRARSLRLEDYVTQGVMDDAQVREIRRLLKERRNIVVSGGTGTGKTTLLRALLREVTDRERILICEDTQELALDGFNVKNMRTTLNIDLSQLMQQAMRMRPDRIIVGEVRGPEAAHAIQAMNSGHPGTLMTLHSNGTVDALSRFHTLATMGNPKIPYEWVERAVDVVLQLEGRGKERRLSDIWRVPKPYPDRVAAGSGAE